MTELKIPDAAAFAENLERVKENIALAAQRAGRDPGEVAICAVTKNFDLSAGRLAAGAGIGMLGENRVQEASAKYAGGRFGASLHLIGHLQTNKAARAAVFFDSVDSVDSARLGALLSAAAKRAGKTLDVMAEVNVGDDPAKSGVSCPEARELCEKLAGMECLRLRGLMTVLPLGCSSDEKKRYFDKIRRLSLDISEKVLDNESVSLSMGMTDDYREAVECGSTVIRIGTALFGAR